MSNVLSYSCRTKLEWMEILSPYHGNKTLSFFDSGVRIDQTNVSKFNKFLDSFCESETVYLDDLGYPVTGPLVETNDKGLLYIVF